MKKKIYTVVGLIIVMTILTVTATFAQSATKAKAHIPFDFSVKNQTITAGDYVMNRQDDIAKITRRTQFGKGILKQPIGEK